MAIACEQTVTAPMDRDSFVRVMVELRQAERTLKDSMAFDVKRREILQESGVTDSMLIGFVRVYQGDAEYMSSVWDTIDARLNPTLSPDTTR
jgi:hypothetical protein